MSPIDVATINEFLAGCLHDHGGCGLVIGGVVTDHINMTRQDAFCLPALDYTDPLVVRLTGHPETAAMTPYVASSSPRKKSIPALDRPGQHGRCCPLSTTGELPWVPD